MRLSGTRWALAALIVAASGVGIAQTGKSGSELGRHDYDAYCAGCHGATGRGDGVDKPNVDLNPADLTRLAEKNGGVFPYSRFHDVVDGRFDVEPSDMPTFGPILLEEAAENGTGVRYGPEQDLDRRLSALASHVATLER